MGDLSTGTYYFGNASSAPVIQYRVSYSSTRTGPNNVSTRVWVTILPLRSSTSYYGYTITGYVTIGGSSTSTVTIKGTSPRYWSSAFTVDLGTVYNGGLDPRTTYLDAAVYLGSSGGRASNTGWQTVSFPIGNTPPYWSNGNITSSSYAKNSIIPENASSLNFSWSGARDDQGNTIYYSVDPLINGGYWGNLAYDITSTSVTWNSANAAKEGDSIGLRVYCKDGYTGYDNRTIEQTIFTKNRLTAASLTSGGSISFDSTAFSLSRSNASNTNGNTSFTYTLTCSELTVYNGNVSSVGSNISVAIYRSGTTPSGPYIRFSNLQSVLSRSSYQGTLNFTLSTKNAYGTTKTASRSISANLRKALTAPGSLKSSGSYTVDSQPYYVVNQRGISFAWSAVSDPNGTTPVYYDIETSTDGGAWTSYKTGLTTASCTLPTMNRSSQGTLQFRVQARTKYGTVSSWTTSEKLPVHYYYPPTLSGLSVDRKDVSQTTTGTVKQNTSIPVKAYNLTVQYKKDSAVLTTQNLTMSGSQNLSYTQSGISESDTFTETVTVSDDISPVFAIARPQSSANVIVPRYAAMLTIREKGVGINAVAGDFADFVAKGTMSLFGGDTTETADGTINLSTRTDSGLSIYSGIYMDSAGVLRGAQDLEANQKVLQLKVFWSDQRGSPLGWRALSCQTPVVKDAVFKADSDSGWHMFSSSPESGVG